MPNAQGLAVITGASRGIGLALVNRYLEAGFPVLAIARDTTVLPACKNLTVLDADLAGRAGITRVAEAVKSLRLPVAVLINNAGVQNAVDFTGPDSANPECPDCIRDEIALNLTAPMLLALCLLPLMLRPGGTIVNVTSLVSRQPKPSAPVYSASKAGLASFTQSLRVQLRSEGIHLVEAIPPLVDTGMTAGRGSGKISPEAMADAISSSVRDRKRLAAPGLSRRVLLLNRFWPELVGKILARS
ncbi:SDR family NAD(P)-dependent oxidoreductase [uncultured Hoeflea sp.]|uniref:SDR family NAD(P)-dependent oxidoreductase n=1 Tax=uncultured Hoeflea sp. TaxID=538666 RepID=UPI0030D96275|tara:strand:- start:839 stop:1570 length:732 start_codon:yes stop_codon:yes gene_type:complete